MKTEILPTDRARSLMQAFKELWNGELVAFPTDTVYGLGAFAFDAKAIQKLYEVKGRENSKAIPILLSKAGQLSQVTNGMNPMAQRLAGRFWPGPLTLVVPRHPDLPEIISPTPTIGVRMPDNGRIPLILDGGRTRAGIASTVVDCTQDELVVLRQGPLSEQELRQALT
jgi:L-threonylcarbamoyladenylate synthase